MKYTFTADYRSQLELTIRVKEHLNQATLDWYNFIKLNICNTYTSFNYTRLQRLQQKKNNHDTQK